MAQNIIHTESLCPTCFMRIPAMYITKETETHLHKTCPTHGSFSSLIWIDANENAKFSDWSRPKIPTSPFKPLTVNKKNCPFECGLCTHHKQGTCMALLEITSRCNLACPLCFAAAESCSSAENYTGAENLNSFENYNRSECLNTSKNSDSSKKSNKSIILGSDDLNSSQHCKQSKNLEENINKDPSLEALYSLLDSTLIQTNKCNLQISGGEPTVRDDLPEIISYAKKIGFPFVQVNSNGLRMAEDEKFVEKLALSGVDSVFLQFDGLEKNTHIHFRGRDLREIKKQAIENLAKYCIGIILVPVISPYNFHEIGSIIRFAIEHAPHVRGVHFQPISYFGRYTKTPTNAERIPLSKIIHALEKQTDSMVSSGDFVPPSCEHALCSFHANYVIKDDKLELLSVPKDTCDCSPKDAEDGANKAKKYIQGQWINPQTKTINTHKESAHYQIQNYSHEKLEKNPNRKEKSLEAKQICFEKSDINIYENNNINSYKSNNISTDKNNNISTEKQELNPLDAFIQTTSLHRFSISAMAFQDAWTVDIERLSGCCIHVIAKDGKLVPFCAYNITNTQNKALYRK